MATLGRLTSIFDADTKRFDAGAREVQRGVAGVEKSLTSLSNSSRGFAAGILPGLANISEIIQGIPQIGRLAGGLIRPLTDAAEEGVRLNMVLETAQIGFEGVAGSAKKSQEHIAALMAFGKSSPFRFEGLLEASRFMTAFGFSLDEQIPKLTVWGNALAASGELSAAKVQDVVRAFGQMRMAGRVNAQDMNQLTNANIPGWELLAKAIGKTVAQTRSLAEAGKLEGGQAVEAITAMMGQEPRFKDMMKRMEGTGAGRLSAAQDVIQFAQAKATTTLTQDISTTLGAALQKQNVVGELAGTINMAIAPVSGLIKTAAMGILGGGLTSGFIEGIQSGKDAVKQAVGDFALDGIIGTAKSWLGIQSPSTVFYDMGLMSAEGFALGLKAGFKENPLVEELRRLLEDPRIRAFMEAIKKAEGGAPNRIVGRGGTFSDFSKHPNKVGIRTAAGPSTAAGSYQITATTWRGVSKALGLPDFSEPSQILAALELFRRTGGVAKLQRGDFAGAVKAAGNEWQSLPGSSLGGNYHVSQTKFQGLYNQALTSMSFDGQAVSRNHPLPVSLVGLAGGATGKESGGNVIPGAPLNLERSAPMRSAGGFNFTDVEWTDAKAQLVIKGFKSAESQVIAVTDTVNKLATQVMPRAIDGTNVLGDAALKAAEAQQQQMLGIGEWGNLVIRQTESLTTRLENLRDALPTLGEQMNNILVDLPQGIGNIFGEAVRQWDGTFKGFLTSLAEGVRQTLADIAAQLVSSAITELLVSLGLSALGGIGGGGKSWADFGKAIGFPHRAMGGSVNASQPYIVGEAGAEVFMPASSGQIIPNHRLPGVPSSISRRHQGGQPAQIHYNFNNNFHLPKLPSGSFQQQRSARQNAEMVANFLRHAMT